MKRRSRTLDKPVGPGRPKTPKSKGSRRQTGASSRTSSTPTAEGEVGRLTRELNEAWEQQAATSEVLQVISNSPDELQPVFDGMLANATRLCGASYGTLCFRESDDQMRMVALHGTLPEAFRETWGVGALHRPNPSVPTARAFAAYQPVHIVDLGEDRSYLERDQLAVASVEVAGIRSLVSVPMLKEGVVVGAMNIYRQEVRPFTDKQIALVQNFAAQAVIAIENARLLNELRQRTNDLTESLEQQTATSEVLQVISSSPGDLEPVFAAMLENAVRICEAKFGNIYRAEGDGLRNVATHNTPPAFAEALRSSPYHNPGPKNPVRRMINTKAIVHVVDNAATEAYAEREPIAVASVELGDTRTLMAVPMLKDDELIGAFTLARQEVRPFTDKQIALVTSFAAQAVIAIENARLLSELRQRTTDLTEALEQQTATSEVLQVISGSPGDLEPVFAAMLASATRICEAKLGNLFLREGETFRAVAWHGEPTYVENWRREPLIIKTDDPHIPLARLVETKQRVHVADLRQDGAYKAVFRLLLRSLIEVALEPFSSSQCSKSILWLVQSQSIVRKFVPSPTSRSRLWRTSLPKR